jgi:hypothetical protein
MIAASLSATVPILAAGLLGACFDFDATTAGGPLTAGDASVVETNPATTADAGLDATTRDATPPPPPDDAGVMPAGLDAAPSNDSGPPPPVDAGHSFCAAYDHTGAKVFFCDDFDEKPLPGAWQSYGEMGGTLTDTTDNPYSSPNAIDEKVFDASTGTTINVAIRTLLAATAPPGTLRFAFAVDPLQIDTTANAAIVLGGIDFLDAAGNRYTMGLAVNVANGAPAMALGEQSAFIDGGVPFTNHQLPPSEPLQMNAWSTVVLQINWMSATTAEAIVTVNGSQELDVQLNVTVVPTTFQIGVGTSYVTEPSPTWELLYDNVVFTAQ